MSEPQAHAGRLKWIFIIGLTLGLLVLGAANVHLVYVSFASQPECVSHTKAAQHEGGYRAARSSC
ncbi:MAG TPA: hypothetical protein VNS12_09330 [Pelagibacterium sp.]|uniref:hypothetical protein n=1 Tax=Pelagibacterium sp. TaxID=1967288 RepID=UPI002C570012|nr:hypothetical protein [Pelagibacterium sp.]HWJ88259.1 hypothetical protein [Pelagibacterium sp.]